MRILFERLFLIQCQGSAKGAKLQYPSATAQHMTTSHTTKDQVYLNHAVG